jgi:hypothetical protein
MHPVRSDPRTTHSLARLVKVAGYCPVSCDRASSRKSIFLSNSDAIEAGASFALVRPRGVALKISAVHYAWQNDTGSVVDYLWITLRLQTKP